jgi:enoyl-CoA hydratase/carnithine racemase
MSEEPVIAQVLDRVGVISLNRPGRRNAFNPAMREGLRAHLEAMERDAAVSVILLRGEGRSFSAGYDLTADDPEMSSLGADPLRWHDFQDKGLKLLLGIWEARTPVVAAVQGHALGFGCALAAICDLVIAAEDAVFGEPEIRFQSIGSAVVLPWIIGARRARELLYTGDLIDAKTAREYGMVNRVVPPQDLPQAAERYARRLAQVGPEALARAKLAVNRGLEAGGFRNGLHAGLDVISPLYTVETATVREFRAGVERLGLREALKRRNAEFE